MAQIILKAKELYSRIERVKIGVREIQKIQPDGSLKKRDDGGPLGFLLGGLKGFLTQTLSLVFAGLSFSWTALWGTFVSGVTFLWNFNWNISDKDIDSQIKSIWLSYASQLGGLAGNSLGYFTCGILPATSMFAFNPAMAAYVINYAREDIVDELASNLAQAIRSTVQATAQTGFYIAYKNIRKVLRDGNSPLRKLIPGIDKWGKSGGPVVSIAKGYEKAIDKIPNPFVKNFTESLLEEWWEGCVEAGFIITGAMDAFVWEQKSQNKQLSTEVIEVIPDREAPNEAIVLSGNKPQLKSAITTTLAVHQLIQNRDIGYLVGYPSEQDIMPHPSEITLHIHYSSQKESPFQVKGAIAPYVKISNVKRSKLDWEQIKLIADKNGYQWGRFLAIAKMSSGRKIKSYGATDAIAKNRVMELSAFTDDDIQVINTLEETGRGGKIVNPKLRKEARQVYPFKAVIVVNRIVTIENGVATNDGKNRVQKQYKFFLWQEEAPIDFNRKVQELFTDQEQ